MKIPIILISLAGTVMVFVSTSHAIDAIGPGDSDSRWIIGASTFKFNNIYKGESNGVGVVPNLRFNGKYFFVNNGTLNLSFGKYTNFSGGLTARYSGGFLNKDNNYNDNVFLVGLQERKNTTEAGFYINHSTDLGRLKMTVFSDIENEHQGQSVALSYVFDFNYANWFINPAIGASWVSDKKINHLYGVSRSEATLTRAAYQADSAYTLFAGVRARYEISEHWDISLATGVTRLDSAITNSSIVKDRNYLYSSGVNISYNF